MRKTSAGAEGGLILPGAQIVSRPHSLPTGTSVASPRNTRPTPTRSPYDPNADGAGRPRSTCGKRFGCRRDLSLGGAWVHCGLATMDADHMPFAHVCGPLCVGKAGAA